MERGGEQRMRLPLREGGDGRGRGGKKRETAWHRGGIGRAGDDDFLTIEEAFPEYVANPGGTALRGARVKEMSQLGRSVLFDFVGRKRRDEERFIFWKNKRLRIMMGARLAIIERS